ncbi:MAG: hypothetical protein ACLR71_14440 [[Clostridium] scindens]
MPVIGITAREEIGLERIFLTLQQMEKQKDHKPLAFVYEGPVEKAIGMLEPAVEWATKGEENTRWFCARLLDANSNLLYSMEEYLGYSLVEDTEVAGALKEAVEYLAQAGYSKEKISDAIAASYIRRAEQISRKTVQYGKKDYDRRDRRLTGSLPARGPDSRSCSSCFFWCSGLPSAERTTRPSCSPMGCSGWRINWYWRCRRPASRR